MAERELLFVFSYDVRKDSIRRKVSDRLEEELARVQMSVFEGHMTRRAADRLGLEVLALLEEGDSLRVYAVTPAGLKRSFAHGGAPMAEPHGFWLL
jgi:CRISPR-associated endonuclease Cas2